MKAKGYRVLKTDNAFLNRLQSSLIIALISHWIFQGMVYMDRTERLFKIMLDVIIAIIYLSLTGFTIVNLVIGLLIAHTLNFLFNGQIYVVLKCFGISRANQERLLRYLEDFAWRVKQEPSITYAAVYGSYSREALHDKSDIDIRVLRRPGVVNALRSCTFVMLERGRAMLIGVPIDIYVVDNAKSLSRLRQDENPQCLKGSW